ncbi:MAG: VanZ family protein [Clostridium sp.]|nr:VanZ family protein [Clostridium sp.]
MKKILIVFCILWLGFIYYNSSQSGLESNKISYKVVNTISNKNVAEENINYFVGNFNKFIRKNAHLIEYLVLSILLGNIFFRYNKKGIDGIVYILFVVLIFAVSDEFHQLYVVGRNSNVIDIVIDFVGGVIGTIIFYLFYYIIIPKFKNINIKRRRRIYD